MGLVFTILCALQDPEDERIAQMLRQGLEDQVLAERLIQLGSQTASPIAQRVSAGGTARLDDRAAAPILAEALRDPAMPAAARVEIVDMLVRMNAIDENAVGDEELPAEVRLAIAERLGRAGQLNPLEHVIASLARIRRDDPSLAKRTDTLASGLRGGNNTPRVVDAVAVADVAAGPASPPRVPDSPTRASMDVNIILGFGAIALAAVLIATRRA